MKNKSKTVVLSEIGNFLIDVAKLVFGGVILASIMKNENIDQWYLLIAGIVLMLFCFITGISLIELSQKKEE